MPRFGIPVFRKRNEVELESRLLEAFRDVINANLIPSVERIRKARRKDEDFF
jgi:hypothetical protein